MKHLLLIVKLLLTGATATLAQNIGIGTKTPVSLLDIIGTDPTTAYPSFRVINSGGNNRAAEFYNTNSSTTQPPMMAYTIGKGYAGAFIQANNTNRSPAIYANSNGGPAGYFSSSTNISQNIFKTEYTGPSTYNDITAVTGIADSSLNGTGGLFSGGFLGIEAYGSYGGRLVGKLKGAEISVSGNTIPNTDLLGVTIDMSSVTPVHNMIGLESTINGGASQQTIGIYSAPTGTGVVTTFFGLGNINITGAYYSSSDRKLKQNIRPMHNVMDKLLRLVPSTYEYQTATFKMNLPKGNQYGLVAQDVQAVFPELVAEQIKPAEIDNKTKKMITDEVKYLGVNYTGLIPIIISGIQEQEEKIKLLETENTRLKKDIDSIKTKLNLQ